MLKLKWPQNCLLTTKWIIAQRQNNASLSSPWIQAMLFDQKEKKEEVRKLGKKPVPRQSEMPCNSLSTKAMAWIAWQPWAQVVCYESFVSPDVNLNLLQQQRRRVYRFERSLRPRTNDGALCGNPDSGNRVTDGYGNNLVVVLLNNYHNRSGSNNLLSCFSSGCTSKTGLCRLWQSWHFATWRSIKSQIRHGML